MHLRLVVSDHVCLQTTWVAEYFTTFSTGKLLFAMHVHVVTVGTASFKPFSTYCISLMKSMVISIPISDCAKSMGTRIHYTFVLILMSKLLEPMKSYMKSWTLCTRSYLLCSCHSTAGYWCTVRTTVTY